MSALTNPVLWGYLLVLLPFLLFSFFYGFKSPWTLTAAGRGLMILSCTLSLALIQTVVTLFLGPDWWGRAILRTIFLSGGFTSGWYLLYTLLRLQAGGRRLLDSKVQNDAPPEHVDHMAKHRLKVAIRREARKLRKLARRL